MSCPRRLVRFLGGAVGRTWKKREKGAREQKTKEGVRQREKEKEQRETGAGKEAWLRLTFSCAL